MKLPRTLSMRRKSEFLRVRSEGDSFGGRHLVLAVLEDPAVPAYKTGFVVPKRVGKAVARNKVKRRLRSIFGTTAARLKSHCYVVTVARRGSAELPFAALRKEWRWLAGRAGLFAESGSGLHSPPPSPASSPASSPATPRKEYG